MAPLIYTGAPSAMAGVEGERVSVIVADDHPTLREGVARGVRERPELKLVGEASDGRQALLMIRELRPQVALLDLRMPELDGLGVLAAVIQDELPTRVVFLSAFTDGASVHAALSAGAVGFLTKGADRVSICDALLAAARGETVLSPELHTGLAEQLRARGQEESGPRLSAREREVLRLTAAGLNATQIAAELVIATTTVRTHLQNVYDKLGVSDRAAAVAEGMRRGLVE